MHLVFSEDLLNCVYKEKHSVVPCAWLYFFLSFFFGLFTLVILAHLI